MREFKDIKVAVAGTGYVGLSIATLLSQHHHVTAVDVIVSKKRDSIPPTTIWKKKNVKSQCVVAKWNLLTRI